MTHCTAHWLIWGFCNYLFTQIISTYSIYFKFCKHQCHTTALRFFESYNGWVNGRETVLLTVTEDLMDFCVISPHKIKLIPFPRIM